MVVVAAPWEFETAVVVGSTTAAGEVSATTVETGLTVEVELDEVEVEEATSFTGEVETASKVVDDDEEADEVATVAADPAAVVIPAGVVSVSV